jgi:hypothetical protein
VIDPPREFLTGRISAIGIEGPLGPVGQIVGLLFQEIPQICQHGLRSLNSLEQIGLRSAHRQTDPGKRAVHRPRESIRQETASRTASRIS